MKISTVLAAILVLVLALLTSCATLRLSNPLKVTPVVKEGEPHRAAYQAASEEGWAARYIPGWKKLSDLIPPPNEARKDWDQWLNGRGRPGHQPEM
jgi:hypothetical protein